MRLARWALAAGVATVLGGCGVPIQSGAHFASGVEPPGRVTFAWNDQADNIQGDIRLEDNALFHETLHEVVEWELNLRGLRHSESGPELVIHHHLSLADHEIDQRYVDEEGYESSESFVYEGGSVVVHIADARTGEDLWVGWAQASVESALTGPDAMRGWVYDLVEAMFRSWPVPPRAVNE